MNNRAKWQPGESQAKAIQEAKVSVERLAGLALATVLEIGKLQTAIREVQSTDESDELKALQDHLARASSWENMQEFQSFSITANRVLGEAWRRLP